MTESRVDTLSVLADAVVTAIEAWDEVLTSEHLLDQARIAWDQARVALDAAYRALGPITSDNAALLEPDPGAESPSVPDEPGSGTAAVPSPVEEAPSRDHRGAEEAVAVRVGPADKRHQNGRTRLSPDGRQAIRDGRAAGRSIDDLAREFEVSVSRVSQLTSDMGVSRVQREEKARYDVQAMFAIIRRTNSLMDAAMELGIQSATLSGRLDVLQGRGELPDDILAKRPQKIREDAAKRVALLAEPAVDETFEDRRKRMAREASERTWRASHPDVAQA